MSRIFQKAMRSGSSSWVTVNKAHGRERKNSQPWSTSHLSSLFCVSWQHPFLESLWAVHQLQHQLGGGSQDGEHLPRLTAVPGPQHHVRGLCSTFLHDHLVSENRLDPYEGFPLRHMGFPPLGNRSSPAALEMLLSLSEPHFLISKMGIIIVILLEDH